MLLEWWPRPRKTECGCGCEALNDINDDEQEEDT